MNRAFAAKSRMLVRTCLAVLGVAGLVGCETEPQLVPDLPDSGQVDSIPLTDGSAVATTENGRATFQKSFYREPVTVVPMNRHGSTVDEPLDVYFAEGDEGEVAVWVVDAGTDPKYTPYYVRGKLDELGSADAALDSQLFCGGLCLGAAVIGIGTTMVTGVLAGAKHDIEAVSEILGRSVDGGRDLVPVLQDAPGDHHGGRDPHDGTASGRRGHGDGDQCVVRLPAVGPWRGRGCEVRDDDSHHARHDRRSRRRDHDDRRDRCGRGVAVPHERGQRGLRHRGRVGRARLRLRQRGQVRMAEPRVPHLRPVRGASGGPVEG